MVTRSRPQSELQVINLFLCRDGCGELLSEVAGVTNFEPDFLGKKKENLPPRIHRVFLTAGTAFGQVLMVHTVSVWELVFQLHTSVTQKACFRIICVIMSGLVVEGLRLRWPDSRESIRRFARSARFSRIVPVGKAKNQ